MPKSCCVPNCKSNYYNEGYVTSFAFPKDPSLREEWRKLIPREDLKITDNTVVCEKHFHPSEVVKIDSVTRDDGSVLTVPRKKAKLLPGSVPTIFPDGRGVVQHYYCDLKMPKKCCVPGCNSNYESTNEYVTVFKFPSDSHMKERWMKCIPRNNWSPTKSSVVCRKHFLPCDMSLSTKFTDKKGVQREFLRKNPVLKEGACPSLFLEVSSDFPLSQTNSDSQKQTSESISNVIIKSEDVKKEICEDDSFDEEVTGMEKVNQPGSSGEDDGRTDGISSCTWSYFNNCQIDDQKMESSCRVQHSQPVRPDILLDNLPDETDNKERVRNIVKNTEDETEKNEITEDSSSTENTEYEADNKERLEEQIKIIENTRRKELDYETMNEHKRDNRKRSIKTWKLKLASRIHDKKDLLKVSECQETCLLAAGVTGADQLTEDRVIHTGENSHKCDVCDAEFSHSNCLKVHSRIHTKEDKGMTYKCLTCGAVFVTEVELKVHKITHRPFILGDTTCDTAVSPWKVPTGEKPYKCDFCDAMFSGSSGLLIHRRIHMGEKPYLCDVCGIAFCTFPKLVLHRRIHIGEKSYKCDVCDRGFSRSIILKLHTRTHTGEKPYTCNVCGAGFSLSSSFRVHIKKHKEVRSYVCDVCGAGYTRADDLKVHIRKHTGEKPYKCNICGVSFTTANSLTIHNRTHRGEKPYMCDVCGTGFSSSPGLKVHKIIHTGEKPYNCDICGAKFSNSSNLTRHKRTHTGVKPYKCDVCDVGFARSCNLAVHRRIHTGEKSFTCDVCNVSFSDSDKLKQHKMEHTGEMSYKCDVCGVKFSHSSILKVHRKTHTGERSYKCDVCRVGFSSSMSLKKHKVAHTGELTYKCDVCNVGFSRFSSLKMHRRIHPSEKSRTCDFCGIIFSKSGDLTLHRRIHTGERPYMCDICGVRFTRSGHLKTHSRIHTGEKPYKCDICGVGFSQSGDRTRHKRTHTREKV